MTCCVLWTWGNYVLLWETMLRDSSSRILKPNVGSMVTGWHYQPHLTYNVAYLSQTQGQPQWWPPPAVSYPDTSAGNRAQINGMASGLRLWALCGVKSLRGVDSSWKSPPNPEKWEQISWSAHSLSLDFVVCQDLALKSFWFCVCCRWWWELAFPQGLTCKSPTAWMSLEHFL